MTFVSTLWSCYWWILYAHSIIHVLRSQWSRPYVAVSFCLILQMVSACFDMPMTTRLLILSLLYPSCTETLFLVLLLTDILETSSDIVLWSHLNRIVDALLDSQDSCQVQLLKSDNSHRKAMMIFSANPHPSSVTKNNASTTSEHSGMIRHTHPSTTSKEPIHPSITRQKKDNHHWKKRQEIHIMLPLPSTMQRKPIHLIYTKKSKSNVNVLHNTLWEENSGYHLILHLTLSTLQKIWPILRNKLRMCTTEQ